MSQPARRGRGTDRGARRLTRLQAQAEAEAELLAEIQAEAEAKAPAIRQLFGSSPAPRRLRPFGGTA